MPHSGNGFMPHVILFGPALAMNGEKSELPSCFATMSLKLPCSLVYGFVDRQDAHDMLLKCCPGTFLIRFSQHQPGLSVAFVKSKYIWCGVCYFLFSHCCMNVLLG